jgi:hypothetical protein
LHEPIKVPRIYTFSIAIFDSEPLFLSISLYLYLLEKKRKRNYLDIIYDKVYNR